MLSHTTAGRASGRQPLHRYSLISHVLSTEFKINETFSRSSNHTSRPHQEANSEIVERKGIQNVCFVNDGNKDFLKNKCQIIL